VAVTLAEPREHRMLKTIERVTKQRIAVEKVPTTADLKARRLELTRAALVEAILEDELERYRVIVEALTDQFDVMEVALAAVKLAHEAGDGGGAGDEEDIPEIAPPRNRDGDRDRDRDRVQSPRPPRPARHPSAAMTRIFVGAGRTAGIRPQDLVGAITGETRLGGRDIGAIEIADRFALVEVPDTAVDEVVAALRATTIKGRKATVRRAHEDR
jgi:ATP-dependent RNA helicase DeaD